MVLTSKTLSSKDSTSKNLTSNGLTSNGLTSNDAGTALEGYSEEHRVPCTDRTVRTDHTDHTDRMDKATQANAGNKTACDHNADNKKTGNKKTGNKETESKETESKKTENKPHGLDSVDDPISLWHDRWAPLFPEPRSMRFANGVVRNPYCGDCRFCCCPQDEPEPFPMALLDSQVSSRTKDDFHLLDEHTAALDQRGCKSLGPTGCKLENHLRPIACNLFPYVLVNDRILLYLVCPAVMFGREEELVALGKEVHASLATLARGDLARIAITRSPGDLARKYRDLGLPPLL